MKKKYNYRFIDPNPPGVFADELVKLLIELNKPKVEAAIREYFAKQAEEEQKATGK